MPFMRGLRITGGNRLSGTIAAHGAKNAVLPILAATVLCSRSEIKNCPNLSDVAVSCHILRHLGFAVERARDTLIITREDTGCRDVPSEWMRAMRSSILFLGGMLARCGSVTLCPPGGCALGGRPIDLHLSALRQMGAVISEEGDTLRCAAPGGLHGAAVQLPYPSVGATENLLIAAAGTPAETKITGAAAEPEISDLLAYLRGCGALIESQPDGAILVQGREALTGCCHAILPDRIEAATYLAAAAITGGEITVYASPEHLAAPPGGAAAYGVPYHHRGAEHHPYRSRTFTGCRQHRYAAVSRLSHRSASHLYGAGRRGRGLHRLYRNGLSPALGPCGGTAPLGCGYHGGRQSCSHPGGAPYRVSPHLHRSARRSRCGTSSISGKGRKQRYSYLPHRTRLCRFCSNPAPSGRGYLPDGSLNQRKENQSP